MYPIFLFNQISVYNRNGTCNDAENREMANLALNGLQLLCGWTSEVVETVAWKLLNPTNQRKNPECPEGAETYELATKYNYTPEEKAAIIEVLPGGKWLDDEKIGAVRGEGRKQIHISEFTKFTTSINRNHRDFLDFSGQLEIFFWDF